MAEPRPSPHGLVPHVPALDGLRGLAVLGVLLFHSDALLKGGYLGVDLFFVLSGYLITSILVAEHEKNGKIALGRFWVRRARRLLPALLALMPGIAIYAWLFARTNELATIRADALATLGYIANWRAIFVNKSYWDLFVAPSPLEHTWSLAIEEQFYVFFPLIAAAALAKGKRKGLFAVVLSLGIVACVLLAALYDPGRTGRVYMGTDTRASGMLFGAALATRLPPTTRLEGKPARLLGGLAIVAGLVLLATWLTLGGESPWLYRGGLVGTELLCLVVLAAAVTCPTSLVARALSVPPLRALGNVSYGVYLWHWPVFVTMTPERVHVGPWALLALRLAVTFVIALVSFKVLETPIRKNGLPFGKPWIVVPLAFVGAFAPIAIVTGLRKPPKTPLAIMDVSASMFPTRYSVSMQTLPPPEALRKGTLRVLTLGDSVASFLGIAMRHAQNDHEVFVAERGVGSCTLFESETRIVDGRKIESTSCSRDWVKDTTELKPDVTLVVMGGAFLTPTACEPSFREAYTKRMGTLLDAMGPAAGKVIITIVPYPVGRWRWGDVPERVVTLRGAAHRAVGNNPMSLVGTAQAASS